MSHDYFRWTHTCSPEELLNTMQTKGILLRASQIHSLEVLRRGASGRALALRICYEDSQGEQKEHKRAEYDAYVKAQPRDVLGLLALDGLEQALGVAPSYAASAAEIREALGIVDGPHAAAPRPS